MQSDNNFGYGVYKAKFDSEKNRLTVDNKGDFSFFRESGIYGFNVNENLITLEDKASYKFEIDGVRLKLTYVDDLLLFDDEPAHT